MGLACVTATTKSAEARADVGSCSRDGDDKVSGGARGPRSRDDNDDGGGGAHRLWLSLA